MPCTQRQRVVPQAPQIAQRDRAKTGGAIPRECDACVCASRLHVEACHELSLRGPRDPYTTETSTLGKMHPNTHPSDPWRGPASPAPNNPPTPHGGAGALPQPAAPAPPRDTPTRPAPHYPSSSGATPSAATDAPAHGPGIPTKRIPFAGSRARHSTVMPAHGPDIIPTRRLTGPAGYRWAGTRARPDSDTPELRT